MRARPEIRKRLLCSQASAVGADREQPPPVLELFGVPCAAQLRKAVRSLS